MSERYVHGYEPSETQRLQDQASTLVDLLHHDTGFPAGSKVLEAGCGTGAQTVTLARRSPHAHVTAFDRSEASLREARKAIAGLANVTLLRADILDPAFEPGSFDHVFLSFVLEHLPEPSAALARLKRMLKPGGTITVIEGDHGSAFFHPRSEHAHQAIQCQVRLQAGAGGDALIGRRLHPLLGEAGFVEVRVSPRMVYADSSKPAMREGFTRRTFTAMIEGVRRQAIEAGMLDAAAFDWGIADLLRTSEGDGVFCYTFFKATGRRADA